MIEEEPELSIPEATKKAMAQITGPFIAIAPCFSRYSCRWHSSPASADNSSANSPSPSRVSMIISAINALTLSPALCSVLLNRSGRRRGTMYYVLRGIDRVRDGYVSVTRRLVRVAVLGLVLVAALAAASLGLFKITLSRLPAGRGSGRLLRRDAAAGGRIDNRTEELVAQVESLIPRYPAFRVSSRSWVSISSTALPHRTRRSSSSA